MLCLNIQFCKIQLQSDLSEYFMFKRGKYRKLWKIFMVVKLELFIEFMHNSIANYVEQRELTMSNCYTVEATNNRATDKLFFHE